MNSAARLWRPALLGLAAFAFNAMAGDGAARARTQYLHHCTGCHLVDGSGAPAKGIPSMRGLLGQFLTVPGGREFIVQVPGVMNSPLSDRDIANLMNWLLPTLAAETMPADTAPYTANEISHLRRSRPLDVMSVRAELVGRLREAGVQVEPAAPSNGAPGPTATTVGQAGSNALVRP